MVLFLLDILNQPKLTDKLAGAQADTAVGFTAPLLNLRLTKYTILTILGEAVSDCESAPMAYMVDPLSSSFHSLRFRCETPVPALFYGELHFRCVLKPLGLGIEREY